MIKSLHTNIMAWLLFTSLILTASLSVAFDSGSSGADGVLNPSSNIKLPVPTDGIFNFTSVTIPHNVTVTFEKNTLNTPVTFLVSGDVLIQGTISVNGTDAADSGGSGDGNIGDDGLPGQGGAGGFDGGRGGNADNRGGNGLGPGAGVSGPERCLQSGFGGSGGGFGIAGNNAGNGTDCVVSGGPSYGVETLQPLIGGSGGGGGHGGESFKGSGGGGGGGAILIAASGRVTISGFGKITSVGGKGGRSGGANCGGTGGGGSGGAIRVVATTLNLASVYNSAKGGNAQSNECVFSRATGGFGAFGRIRLEAETVENLSPTTPAFSFDQPQDIFVAGLPSLRITSVAGVNAPSQPTGNADIILPETTPNPVSVIFATSNVPLDTTILLTMTPAIGASISVTSTALTGTEASGSASANINLASGPSTLSARVSFTVIASLGNDLSRFAQGEQVKSITLAANMNGPSMTTLITVSGKEYTLPSDRVAAF